MVIVDLPGLRFGKDVLCDLRETARIVAVSITETQQHGAVHLLGFSFGACLAVEVACHLTSAGRTVAYLGLIDSPLRIDDTQRSLRGIVELLMARRGVRIVLKNLAQVLVRTYRAKKKSTSSVQETRFDQAAEYRFEALKTWQPRTCKSDGFILLSIFNYERSRPSWQRICPNCTQIKIKSDHHHVLIGHSLYNVAGLMDKQINTFLQQSE